MRDQKRFFVSVLSTRGFARFLALGLGLSFLWVVAVRAPTLSAQATQQPIPATAAFDNSPICSDSDLTNNDDEARGNPEWKRVNGLTVDPNETPSQPMRV